jgi:RNA polymerase sporulation-specific sigma factor
MDFRNYNDFEIIDLINQGNEEALELMFEKYKYLVAKKISHFNLTDEFDDCFQEGMIVLYKSVRKFNDSHNKSFTRYFETNLEHHFISIVRSRRRRIRFMTEKLPRLVEYEVEEKEREIYTPAEIESALALLSEFERAVFQARFIEGKDVNETALQTGSTVKKVYNAADRIRKKIKMHLQ